MHYYSIVYLNPDPSSDIRLTLAVIIVNNDNVEILPAKKIPCDNCLGGKGRKRFAEIIIKRLIKTNGSLVGLGPYVSWKTTPIQAVGFRDFVKQIVAGW